MQNNLKLKDGKAGAAISVRVSTRSPRTGITKIMEDGSVKIGLSSPPVDGKANEELLKYLAGIMHVPKSNLEIIAGQTSKNKLIVIFGIDSDRVNQILDAEIRSV